MKNEEKLNSLIKEHTSEHFSGTAQVDKEFKPKIIINNKNISDKEFNRIKQIIINNKNIVNKDLNKIKASEKKNQSKFSLIDLINPESNITPNLINSHFKTHIDESHINLNGSINFNIR